MIKEEDKIVMELLEKVEQKKKEIQNIGKHAWITSATLGTTDNVQDRVNLQTCTDIKKLVGLYCFLINLADTWERAIKQLELKEPCVWQGYKVNEWQNDIKARVQQIGINTKKKELDSLEKRLDAIVSPEQRRALEIEKIKRELA